MGVYGLSSFFFRKLQMVSARTGTLNSGNQHTLLLGIANELETPLSPPDFLNPRFPTHTKPFDNSFVVTSDRPCIHRKLYPHNFTNKHSVLGGNFTLGRVSAALAHLGDLEVMQLIAGTGSNIMEGEILQMKDVIQPEADDVKTKLDGTERSQKHQDAWNIYLQKMYLKMASLMAKAAHFVVVLGGCTKSEIWKEVAYAYGRNLGIAFQAWEEVSKMGELIGHKLESSGDVEKARNLVHQPSAISQTKQLAQAYVDEAKNVLQELPPSETRDALEVFMECVVGRKK
ncbi:hypothetical protein D9756_007353 [Leucocoprinus leucothites]|uniref:Uncharacterized protein n=1 Tax=Leucocoprinus leucothites TaxID=201217 RepID=A0A8H5D5N3_9AGAR|nr:hypothetical protein D9756_007353 [Leucoagaricus leucothites]